MWRNTGNHTLFVGDVRVYPAQVVDIPAAKVKEFTATEAGKAIWDAYMVEVAPKAKGKAKKAEPVAEVQPEEPVMATVQVKTSKDME